MSQKENIYDSTTLGMQDAEMAEKLQVYNEVTLECTAAWIDAPQALILPHNGRNFEVKASLMFTGAAFFPALATSPVFPLSLAVIPQSHCCGIT